MAVNGERAAQAEEIKLPSPIEVKSIYETRGGRPLVELRLGQAVVKLEPRTALELGEMLVRAATAAEADTFVFEFARTELRVDDLAAALMLRQFREWRLSRERGTGVGATRTSSDSMSESIVDGVVPFLASTERATRP